MNRYGAPSSQKAETFLGLSDELQPRVDLGDPLDQLRNVGVGRRHVIIAERWRDRKSTRLNSSHLVNSYAVFCLKKKKTTAYGELREADSARDAKYSESKSGI